MFGANRVHVLLLPNVKGFIEGKAKKIYNIIKQRF